MKSIYNSDHGAFVLSVEKNKPAYKAGIRRGDLILSVDSKTIKDANSLKNIIGSFKPNKVITVKIENENNKIKTFKVKQLEKQTI